VNGSQLTKSRVRRVIGRLRKKRDILKERGKYVSLLYGGRKNEDVIEGISSRGSSAGEGYLNSEVF